MYNSFEFAKINLSIFKDEKLKGRKKSNFLWTEYNVLYTNELIDLNHVKHGTREY